MTYVDGFVLVIKKKNIPAYIRMARAAGKMWMKHGALEYKECRGDDLHPKGAGSMKPLLFPKLVKLKAGETVWFSYITYKSKAHRNAVNKKVMKDMDKMSKKYHDTPMPFDMRRLSYAGFTAAVDL